MKGALSKLLQRGTVAEYQNEFEMLINRVTGISESLLTMIYISGLKVALLRARPITLVEAFSLARIIEARFEAIAHEEEETAEKEQSIKEIADTSLQSDVASLKAKGSLDANEEIKKIIHWFSSTFIKSTLITFHSKLSVFNSVLDYNSSYEKKKSIDEVNFYIKVMKHSLNLQKDLLLDPSFVDYIFIKRRRVCAEMVYDKEAEVMCMYKIVLGNKEFRKCTDLYFQRHEGQAVSCEYFLLLCEMLMMQILLMS
ncbi:class II heat shock protein [Tanacetum coccineum]